MNDSTCSYPDCKGRRHARGFCNGHYQQQRQGKALRPLQQQLSAADYSPSDVFNMYVVKKDGCWGWSGTTTSEGYSSFSLSGRPIYAHRTSYEMHVGPIPEGKFIDHMCFNRACSHPAHLRLATNKQNHENRPGLQSNNTSGARGVHRNKKGLYEAYVTHWNARRAVGRFATLEEADAAVTAARNELYTHNQLDRARS